MKVASFDVDAQKGFTPLCPNELPVAGGDEIVDELNAQAQLASYRIGSKDCHPANALWIADEKHPIFTAVETTDEGVDIYWPAHCIVGTRGNELLDGLPEVKDYDYFVFKGIEPNMHPYGACFHDLKSTLSTGVFEFIEAEKITHVIVGGLATDYCVRETVVQLLMEGLAVILNLAACRAVDPNHVEELLQALLGSKLGRFYVAENAEEVKRILEKEKGK